VPIAVNLSVQDLRDRGLPALVQELLERHGLPACMLIVEITESGVMTDPVRASEVLEGLRALGVRVAVDDFGAGHSALGYLKLLPIDEIKIDRSLVQAMVGSAKDRAIVSAAIGLAHQLGLSVVAEGVEDRPTWEALAELGCDLAQGFYFSRPVRSDALPALLALASEPSDTEFVQSAA
jgi:EAL domain-containing protein (putative c-di-GMP-specific phosphodiesterase class I)